MRVAKISDYALKNIEWAEIRVIRKRLFVVVYQNGGAVIQGIQAS